MRLTNPFQHFIVSLDFEKKGGDKIQNKNWAMVIIIKQ